MEPTEKREPPAPTLADLLTEWRHDRGLSLADVARMLTEVGCPKTRAGIHHYERGGGIRKEAATAYVLAFDLDQFEAISLYHAAGLVVWMGGEER
jgi:hypothetical protein